MNRLTVKQTLELVNSIESKIDLETEGLGREQCSEKEREILIEKIKEAFLVGENDSFLKRLEGDNHLLMKTLCKLVTEQDLVKSEFLSNLNKPIANFVDENKKELFGAYFIFLGKIASTKENKMDSSNLAIAVGSGVLERSHNPNSLFQKLREFQEAIKKLIENNMPNAT